MHRFKEQLAPLMSGLLPIIVPRLHAQLGPSWDWSGRTAAPTPIAQLSTSLGGGGRAGGAGTVAGSAPAVSGAWPWGRGKGQDGGGGQYGRLSLGYLKCAVMGRGCLAGRGFITDLGTEGGGIIWVGILLHSQDVLSLKT